MCLHIGDHLYYLGMTILERHTLITQGGSGKKACISCLLTGQISATMMRWLHHVLFNSHNGTGSLVMHCQLSEQMVCLWMM